MMDLDDFLFYFILFLFYFIYNYRGYFIKRSRGTKASQGGHITVTRSHDREKDAKDSGRR